MNRRHFLGALASTTVSGAFLRGQESSSPPSSLVRTPLVLMAPRPDGAEAVWAVNQLSMGKIQWEAPDGSAGTAASDPFGLVPQGEKELRVRLAGLKPGVSYRVRSVTISAGDGQQETSPWKTLRTLDPSANSSRFVVWNDTHAHSQTIQKLHALTPPADFLLWNGDTCNQWTSPELLIPTLLHPGGCDISEGRPLLMVWGNHDVRGPYAFEMPRVTPTPSGRPFYAFRSGPVAAICLHTGEDKPDNHPSFKGRVSFDSLRREETEWLAETVRRPELRDAPFRIVFCHIPLRWLNEDAPDYGNGGFDHFSLRSRRAWGRTLLEWGTQLIISGHTHMDAWIPPSDEFSFGQVTGGGPTPASATWISAAATGDEFTLQVRGLDGKIRHEVKLPPRV
jgi:Calcineurin-like phosphoesterase